MLSGSDSAVTRSVSEGERRKVVSCQSALFGTSRRLPVPAAWSDTRLLCTALAYAAGYLR